MASSTIPTLSQIQSWDIHHLESAARHWDARAHNWEGAFTSVYHQVPAPGGVPWEGRAADAALQRVGTDRLQAVAAAETLHGAAAAAREGAFRIAGAKQAALQAVQAAHDDGFAVGEDLSVTDRTPRTGLLAQAQRQAQAQAHSAAIRGAAADLAGTDGEVASHISTAANGLNQTQFQDTVQTSADDQIVGEPTPGDPHIQVVDNTTGPPSPTPTPGGQPQIGPFPVPPGIGNAPAPQAPRPGDPTGGLLTPENLPAPSPPPNVPGVTQWAPPPPPGAPPVPSIGDLAKKVDAQGQIINDMQNAQHNVTVGGLLGSGLAGCVSGGAVGALPTAVFPPADVVSVPGGCVVGTISGLSGYLATIWGANALAGN